MQANRTLLIIILFFPLSLFSQSERFINKVFGQDSTKVCNRKSWVDWSFGPSITLNPDGLYLYVFGPSLDFTCIDKNYRLIKVKSSYHQGFKIFENFHQNSGEISFMTGKINIVDNHSEEIYYGIGIIAGQKHSETISDGTGGAHGFSVSLPYTEYAKKNFIFICIPIEYKIQWRIIGLGIDGNLNPFLPYLGIKWFMKIGDDQIGKNWGT